MRHEAKEAAEAVPHPDGPLPSLDSFSHANIGPRDTERQDACFLEAEKELENAVPELKLQVR